MSALVISCFFFSGWRKKCLDCSHDAISQTLKQQHWALPIHSHHFVIFPVYLWGPVPRWVFTIWQMYWFPTWEGSRGFLSSCRADNRAGACSVGHWTAAEAPGQGQAQINCISNQQLCQNPSGFIILDSCTAVNYKQGAKYYRFNINGEAKFWAQICFL